MSEAVAVNPCGWHDALRDAQFAAGITAVCMGRKLRALAQARYGPLPMTCKALPAFAGLAVSKTTGCARRMTEDWGIEDS
jgi:hypothetical protein